MTLTVEQLDQLELQKEEAQKQLQIGEAHQRLLANPDYKLVIAEGFLTEYPKDLGLAIAKNTGAYNADELANILKGINTLVGYNAQLALNYQTAVQVIQQIEEVIANQDLDVEVE